MTSLHLYEETFSDQANSDDWLIDDNCHNFDDLKKKIELPHITIQNRNLLSSSWKRCH